MSFYTFLVMTKERMGTEPFPVTTQTWEQKRMNMSYDLLLHNIFKYLRQGEQKSNIC